MINTQCMEQQTRSSFGQASMASSTCLAFHSPPFWNLKQPRTARVDGIAESMNVDGAARF